MESYLVQKQGHKVLGLQNYPNIIELFSICSQVCKKMGLKGWVAIIKWKMNGEIAD